MHSLHSQHAPSRPRHGKATHFSWFRGLPVQKAQVTADEFGVRPSVPPAGLTGTREKMPGARRGYAPCGALDLAPIITQGQKSGPPPVKYREGHYSTDVLYGNAETVMDWVQMKRVVPQAVKAAVLAYRQLDHPGATEQELDMADELYSSLVAWAQCHPMGQV